MDTIISIVFFDVWEWTVLRAYRKFGWLGGLIAFLAPITVIALAIWLIVVAVS